MLSTIKSSLTLYNKGEVSYEFLLELEVSRMGGMVRREHPPLSSESVVMETIWSRRLVCTPMLPNEEGTLGGG